MVTIHARRRARRVAVWRGETSLAPARHPADWDEDHLPWDPTGAGWEAYNTTGLVPVDLAGNADDNFQARVDLTVSREWSHLQGLRREDRLSPSARWSGNAHP